MSFIEYKDVTRRFKTLTAVNHLSMNIHAGESVGLVGESGSGKSTAANLLLRMRTPTEGQILWNGQDVHKLKGAELHRFRSEVQMVFQDTGAALDPYMKILDIIAEPIRNYHRLSKGEIRSRATELMEAVSLDSKLLDRYPRELSGGQRQRVAIARTLAMKPKLIVLDEATAGLDVSVQAQILNLLKELHADTGVGYLVISHDLGVIQHMCDRIVVMYRGCKVEELRADELLDAQHPYSRMLLDAIPGINRMRNDAPIVPWTEALGNTGCPFAHRCTEKTGRCEQEMPDEQKIGNEHWISCHCRSNYR